MIETYYTVRQVAEKLGNKSPRTVRQMVLSGQFGPTLQTGREHLVSESGLKAYIMSHMGEPTPYQRNFTTSAPRRRRGYVAQKLEI